MFKDQSSKDLRFHLLYESLNKTNLTILEKKSIDLGEGVAVEAAIIGESHYISFKHNGETLFTELLACIDMSTQHTDFDVYTNVSSLNVKRQPLGYSINIRTLKADQKIIDTFGSSSRDLIHLNYLFDNKDFDVEAKTEIKIMMNVDMLEIYTLHSYPNEDKIVLTESKLDIQVLTKNHMKEAS